MTAETARAIDPQRAEQITVALAVVRERITAAARAAGRDPDTVGLIAVTKNFPAADAAVLVGAGAVDLGESRVQEAGPKTVECADMLTGTDAAAPRWHMLGRIQRNKTRALARWAHAAHSVDSARLITALSNAVTAAAAAGERAADLQVYLQVSLDGDPTRGGAPADQLGELADQVGASDGLVLAGLMGVPPLGTEPERGFAELARLHERLRADHPGATELSAGMSADLEAAVAHGSTRVRVGTAILGDRPITSP